MGLFETYRIAGGDGGMRHFISQFGECLTWPWTKLTDVPELTDELIDTIAAQSDEQSGHHDIRELERIREHLFPLERALLGTPVPPEFPSKCPISSMRTRPFSNERGP
jgi:carnitine 3-dehydrogenase